jgi:hypothetical protein
MLTTLAALRSTTVCRCKRRVQGQRRQCSFYARQAAHRTPPCRTPPTHPITIATCLRPSAHLRWVMDDDIRADGRPSRPFYPGFHPQYSGSNHRTKIWVGGLALLAMTGVGYWAWTQQRSAPPPPIQTAPVTAAAQPASAALPASAVVMAADEPVVKHPISASAAAAARNEAAAPQDLDAGLRNALIDTLGAKALSTWLQTDGFARRVVATVDNLGREHAAPRLWPVLPMQGRFTVQGAGDATTIAAANAARYSRFVAFAASVDAQRAADLYKQHYPLFQTAYQALGFPERYFNDRLVAVIDLLLATPEPTEPVAVRLVDVKGPDGNTVNTAQPWLRYEFADPALQALPAGQKMLLRLGREHRERLKVQLRAFRGHIASASLAPKN